MKELVADLRSRDDAVVVLDNDGSHRLSEILAAGQELAGRIERVTGPGATLLLQADNTWRTVVGMVAAGQLGGTLALINRHSTRQEFEAACEDIVPDAVIAAPPSFSDWNAASYRPEIAAGVLDGWRFAGAEGQPSGRWGDGVVIGLTSGSTGRAKGVVQSEGALRYACRATIEAVGLTAGDAVGAMVPLSSAAAICFGAYLPLLLGGRMVLLDQWDPAEAVRLLTEHQARWTMCVPTMALQMSAAAPEEGMLAAMTALTVGGGPMDAGALGRAERRLGTRFLRVFGMSECLGHTTSLPADGEDIRLGTDGTPFAGTVLRAVDESGSPLPAGEIGRAQVRGPSLFTGYARGGSLARPELTPDGFLPTGDLVEVRPDGRVAVKGREKDIIIRGGRNIDIAEVENAVAHHPQVDQVCVVAVPDELLGERVAALVVTSAESLGLSEIQDHLRQEGLMKGKWPEYVFRVDALPQNRVGKLSRRDAAELAQRLRDGTVVPG
ncbi:long-chain fatty acid--CoA ligase [Amycolatopsis sp. K13G38]|uniref:Long-chain fatty acid--CoA ligase n=1 Tax=Amycolatopsis acididurans TaxID=2724524 RepID=A0ABX1J4U3_9PSEU|nr:fatty acid--CoA ligase family protein [Amycolatopsis acididurans]NKQ54689.1 long-chain fatty acid--CoA ligase [Amycolatopsis acididurans]